MMSIFNSFRREKRANSVQFTQSDPSAFFQLIGANSVDLPVVNIETALKVPAVTAAVAFLSRTLAALPLHAYKSGRNGATRIKGGLEDLVAFAPNPEMGTFKFRQYFWQQVFTGGRGLAYIERDGSGAPRHLYALNPGTVNIAAVGGRTNYECGGLVYPASDVIDVPFMLRPDMVSHYGPIALAAKTIQLALAMGDYAGGFFAGGGVPPLAVVGPLPTGAEAMNRAVNDIARAIESAKGSSKPIFPMPPGHELKPVGFDPEKGQMTEARRFQIEEIARAFQIPPVFLQDLTHGTFSNTEQQDLHLVKHLIAQWASAFEGELNLKLTGGPSPQYVEHNLDGLMRGDFSTRMSGYATGIQNGVLTPNEARAKENRPAKEYGDELLIQGATVPLGQQPTNDGAAV